MSRRKRALKITWREAWPIWLTFGILSGLGALGFWVLIPAPPAATWALLLGEDVTASIKELQPNLPRVFAYSLESGRTAEFLVEREADNTVIVAFASCRRCYRSGHYRQGSQILCGRCNGPMTRVLTGQKISAESDCDQIPIPFERSGDRLIVRADLLRDTFARWYLPVLAQQSAASRKPN